MARSKVSSFGVLAVVFLAYAVMAGADHSPAPAPAPTNYWTSIDQGIAYVLILVALVLTYLIH